PWVTGKFVLHLLDDDELNTDLTTDLTVLIDPLPEVKLITPRSTLTRTPDGNVTFKFLVTDEQFAIKSVFVESRRKADGDGDFRAPAKTTLYDANDFGKLLPIMMGSLPFKAPELRLRYKKLDVDMVWP